MASNVVVRRPMNRSDVGKLCLISAFSLVFLAVVRLFTPKEKMEFSLKQAFSQVLDVGAGSVASSLNVLLQNITHLLQATGIQAVLPVNPVTPEGIIFVTQWAFLLLICYGLIVLAYVLVILFLRWLWWLLKVGVALVCFGLILTDNSVDKKTTVFRLLCFGCVCILLSISPWKNRTMAARIVHLEEQVKILEKRVKERDRWRKGLTILSYFLMGLLCFLYFILVAIYTAISKS